MISFGNEIILYLCSYCYWFWSTIDIIRIGVCINIVFCIVIEISIFSDVCIKYFGFVLVLIGFIIAMCIVILKYDSLIFYIRLRGNCKAR